MRRLRDRIAAFESTDFDLIRSDISRFAAMSSLFAVNIFHTSNAGKRGAHRELEVALSICSSSWVEDVNQPAIMVRHASPSSVGRGIICDSASNAGVVCGIR
jgi:hypothetical protein